jgi:probable F420-dependent oxidoreductase
VKLGLNIRNFGPSAGPAALRGWARFAEDSGFALAMISDHVALTPDVAATYPAPFYDSLTSLAWLAGLTSTLELGTSVAVLPYRNPLLVARMGASIDQFSGGRFVFGVGVGWSEPEFRTLGLPFTERGRMTDDYLAAVIALWTDDVASMTGTHVEFQDVATGPRPARSPHPPIWVGGASAVAIRRVVRYADTWHPINADLGWLRDRGLPALRMAAEAAGRPVPPMSPRMQIRLTPGPWPGSERAPGEGSIDQIRADLEEFAELGADYLVLDTNPDDPHDHRDPAEDWRILETVAALAPR